MLVMDDLSSSRTRLVQRRVRVLSHANTEFSSTGPSGHEVCLVVVPDNSPACCCCPCHILTQVPSGPYIFRHDFGAFRGEMAPGAHWCLPAWKGVSHLVTKQVVTFNAMPKKVPTRDAVFVNVDLSVNFRIGPDMDRVQTFVFRMGAERLDAYLNLSLEEGIRSLVYGVNHDKVNDLRSEFAAEMLRTLQSKASRFGVEVLNVKVTDVQLPSELQERLEKTTAFRTRILEEQKNHEHVLQQLANASEQTFAEIDQGFKIQLAKISAQAERFEIEMDERLNACKSDGAVKLERAKGDQEVALVDAKGDITVAEYEGRTYKRDLVESTRIKCDARLQQAKVDFANDTAAAKAERDASTLLADARVAEAQADGLVAERTQHKLLFEDQIQLARIDAVVAEKGRKVLSGGDGADILNSLVSVRADLMQRD